MSVQDVPFTHKVPVATLHGATHLKLVPDEAERAAIARVLDLAAVDSFRLEVDVSHATNGLVKVEGQLQAAVQPVCVVTLDPFAQQVDVPVSLRLAPQALVERMVARARDNGDEDFEAPDVIEDGTIDFGQLATEFLALSLDPYPRKPGAAFKGAGDPAEARESPFAALAALKDKT